MVVLLIILVVIIIVPIFILFEAWVLMFLLSILAYLTGWAVALEFWPCVAIVLLLNFIGSFFRSSN